MKADLKICTPYNDGLKYKKPLKLVQALKMRQYAENKKRVCAKETSLEEFLEEVAKNKKLSGTKVSAYVGKGASAIVFETPEGKILKLTRGNHFPLNRPPQDFDVPIYKKGKSGSVHYYLEEKMYGHGLGEGFVDIMRDMIRKAGFKPYDMYDSDYFQLGMSREGKLYRLDPECARYKTIFHAIWDKVKRFCKK